MTDHTTIDVLDFARKSGEIRDTIAPFDFSRLRDQLFSPDGKVHYRLTGGRSAEGFPQLTLHLSGKLDLVCQRCLGPLEFELDHDAVFFLVADENHLPPPEDERDDVEYLVANAPLDVVELVEDEVLLSLPLAPAHEDVNCNAALHVAQEQKESPFKVLQGLVLNKD
ncbi:MAG: DUF177 domain-containing protein [Methylobacillus sp.]|jgi:uncharacterized protein|nr:DUF177 domain-containing protein [Methylobacillus sp.]